jgi:hydroxymethylbilane synthase
VKLRIGTRGSDLARTQSGTVAARLADAGFAPKLKVIRTAGDRSAAAFGSIGPQGVFVREIEQALLQGAIDVAVHSFKDLPSVSPAELLVAAVPERLDPADVLIVREAAYDDGGDPFLPLQAESRVGTASVRRRLWLGELRPDLRIEPLRGNVPTRLQRLREGRYDAIVLASAGLERLRASNLDGVAERLRFDGLVMRRLDPERFVPAPTQGALAIQCRRDDADVRQALAGLDDAPSRRTAEEERALLARVEGGCDAAFGAHCAALTGDEYRLVAMLEHGGRVLRHSVSGAFAVGELAAELWTHWSNGVTPT